MNFDRLLLCVLILYLLHLLYQQHRTQIRRLWQRSKDRLPRSWKPKSPRDCACCQTGIAKRRYRSQTPAIAAGLTDWVWTVGELLRTPIILPET